MKNKLALSCLLMVTGFFGACTDMAEDDFQNNKYPVELMAEKEDMILSIKENIVPIIPGTKRPLRYIS